jgi:hypothetical protein
MNSFFDKLNLRPGERRLVVIVGIVVFLVLNVWFVWPNFGEYAATKGKIKTAETNLRRFTMEAGRKGEYEKLLKNLETQGVFVGQEDQALQLQRDVGSQAVLSGVSVLRYDPTPRGASGRTNAFFDEASLIISLSTGEKELIDFLYNLGGARNSLIRVRSMTLNPELPSRMKLTGSLTLVESFQKKPPAARAVSAPETKAAPAVKPAAKPVTVAKPVTPPDKSAGNTKTNQMRKPGPAAK